MDHDLAHRQNPANLQQPALGQQVAAGLGLAHEVDAGIGGDGKRDRSDISYQRPLQPMAPRPKQPGSMPDKSPASRP